jgi:magnesium-transporting ATPase (P-type)
MRRPPRAVGEPLLSGFMIWRIVFVSALLTLGPTVLFIWEIDRGLSIATARTVAVNALVVGQMAYLFNCRYLLTPVRSWADFTGNSYVLLTVAILALIQAIFTYAPFMQTLFSVVDLDLAAWGRIVIFGGALFVVVETEKTLIRRIKKK